MLSKNNISIVDLKALHEINKIDSLNDDLFICEGQSNSEIKHLIDSPIHPNLLVLSLCINGSYWISVDMKKYAMKKNMVSIISPDKIVQNVGMNIDNEYDAYFIGVTRPFFESIFPKQKVIVPLLLYFNNNPLFQLTTDEGALILEYFKTIHKKVKEIDNAYRSEIIQNLFGALIYDFYNIYKKKTSTIAKPKTRKEEIFGQFIQAISRNFQQTRTVSNYADMLYLTPKHLSSVIKEVSGKTPGEWIDQRVILEAKALLKSSDLSIQQIAESLHFANQSFFGKFFRHHVGMSPKQYRYS